MLDTILKYWVQWACGLGAAALSAGMRLLYRRQKQSDLRQRATELGIQALLRDRIIQAYYHYSERGWITLHGLENVEALYKEYHALGGNGTVTKLVEDLRELDFALYRRITEMCGPYKINIAPDRSKCFAEA